MTEKLVEWFVVSLGGKLTKEMVVFIISLFPILELRGGLLAAGPAFLNVKESVALPLCIVGNLCLDEGNKASSSLCRENGKKGHEKKGPD